MKPLLNWRSLPLLLLFLAPLQNAWAALSDARCVSFFKQKDYRTAASCFRRLAQNMGDAHKLSQAQKYKKGQRLRNAAFALNKAALQQSPTAAAYLREEALKLLRLYLKEKLCETSYRCQSARSLQSKLQKQIGYATLTLSTGHPQTTILLQGHHYRRSFQGQTKTLLRPGSYTITITYPQHKETQIKTLHLQPQQKQTISFAPPGQPPPKAPLHPSPRPPSPRPPSLLPWIVAGSGVLVAAGGGLLLALSFSTASRRDDLLPQAKQNLSKTEQMLSLHSQAETEHLLGWILLGAGGAGLLSGTLIFLLQQPPPPPQTTSLAPDTLLPRFAWPAPFSPP